MDARDNILDAVFRRFSEVCFKKEGGYVNDPLDPGGPTNMGVTLETYLLFAPRYGWEPTVAGLKAMTEAQVERVQRAYFDSSGAPLIANATPGGALFLADWGFHSGSGASVRALQRLANALGAKPVLNVDGVIGPVTRNAVTRMPSAFVDPAQTADYLLTKLADDRKRFLEQVYKAQGAAYEARFRQGFTNRIRSVWRAADELNKQLIR